MDRPRLAVASKSRISRISRKHIGKSRIGSPLIKNYLPPIKNSDNPAWLQDPLGRPRLDWMQAILDQGEPILDFPMCFLEILEILDFGTTARRGRPRGSCRQAGLSEFLIGGR